MKVGMFLVVLIFSTIGCEKRSNNSEKESYSGKSNSLANAANQLRISDIEKLKKEAENGNVVVQYNLGYMYDHGEGPVREDNEEAFYWYRMAANQNLDRAQYALAVLYDKGEGVPENQRP